MTLDELRKQIDAIDARLVMLLSERTRLAVDIGRIKHRSGVDAYSPHREQAVLKRVLDRTRGPLTEAAVRAIWREIMSAALAAEKQLVIAYAGPESSAAHEAARFKFGASLRYKSQPGMAEVCAALTESRASYGVVPVEQIKDGTRTHICDLLRDGALKICAEILHPGRHFVVGPQPAPRTGRDKTALLFTLPDRVGALEAALAVFRRHSVNLIDIETRSVAGAEGASVFFIEFRGHTDDRGVARTLDELERCSDLVRVLGSYAEETP